LVAFSCPSPRPTGCCSPHDVSLEPEQLLRRILLRFKFKLFRRGKLTVMALWQSMAVGMQSSTVVALANCSKLKEALSLLQEPLSS
jgi:hypothetical protein